MPKRQRWTPVRGTENRVYVGRERVAVGLADAASRLLRPWLPSPGPPPVREVLVLRLDRIGDLVMSLPALARLRAALPDAHLALAAGRWSLDVARRAPVDEVLEWSAPWAGRPHEGSTSVASLLGAALARRGRAPDLAIDLQGDLRAVLLMAATGARRRVGYANTGAGRLLTDVVPLDETVSWVEQNERAVRLALDAAGVPSDVTVPRPALVTARERATARARAGAGSGPLVGVHPSGGRLIKQWPVERWAEVVSRLQAAHGARVVVTGSSADRPLAAALGQRTAGPVVDLAGALDVGETLALLAELDLFLSSDTGPMHMAAAVGTPSVSVFGPSDSVRYFSGGDPGAPGAKHLVARVDLWCAPCNRIRVPPEECAAAPAPECLHLVTVDHVYALAERLLREGAVRAAGAPR